jgi:diaminopimelate decarboxylase
MNKLTLEPFKDELIKEFDEQILQIIKENKAFFNYTTTKNLVFPQIYSKNFQKIKKEINSENVEIYLANKSTKSISLIKKNLKINGKIEVSSYNELKQAINLGYRDILAGGPKNSNYLELSIKNNCLISIDSVNELERINNYEKQNQNNTIRILIRISNPTSMDRNIQIRTSRFGIQKEDLDRTFELINLNSKIKVLGFHFHGDGYDAQTKKGFVKYFINLVIEYKDKGYADFEYIDIGGGYQTPIFENQNEWLDYINNLQKKLVSNEEIDIWGNYCYGLELNENNKIINRARAENKAVKNNFQTEINTILHSKFIEEYTMDQILFELGLKLILEPGFLLSTTSAITISNVIGNKKLNYNSNLTILNSTLFSLSSNMIEHLSNPKLITFENEKKENKNEKFETFLIGNLCREDDFLIKRKIYFETQPKENDLIIFYNTGSYSMSYENCTPQMQEKSQIIQIKKDEKTKKWDLKYE